MAGGRAGTLLLLLLLHGCCSRLTTTDSFPIDCQDTNCPGSVINDINSTDKHGRASVMPLSTHALENIRKAVPISPNQRAKSPRIEEMVLPEHAHGANPMGVSAAEWESRVEAAAVARALHLYGFGDDLAAQCVMVRLRGHPEEMLMVEWGVFFEEVTASFGLVRVGFDGTLIDSVTAERTPATASVVNMGCLPVAVPIFRERPEVNVILHTHPHAVMAVAATKAGLLPLSQAAFMFHGVVTTYKYDFSYGGDFEGAMANGFKGFTRAMLLEHHGMYTVGRTAAEAFFVTFYINQACEVQVKALAMANSLEDLVVPTNEHLEAQYQDMMLSEDYAYDGSREWGGIVRKLKREAANFNT